jgi:hypothetical protein
MYSTVLSRIHIVLTVLSITFIIILLFLNLNPYSNGLAGTLRRYYKYDYAWQIAFFSMSTPMRMLTVTFLFLLLCQMLLVLNLFLGIIKSQRNNHR